MNTVPASLSGLQRGLCYLLYFISFPVNPHLAALLEKEERIKGCRFPQEVVEGRERPFTHVGSENKHRHTHTEATAIQYKSSSMHLTPPVTDHSLPGLGSNRRTLVHTPGTDTPDFPENLSPHAGGRMTRINKERYWILLRKMNVTCRKHGISHMSQLLLNTLKEKQREIHSNVNSGSLWMLKL